MYVPTPTSNVIHLRWGVFYHVQSKLRKSHKGVSGIKIGGPLQSLFLECFFYVCLSTFLNLTKTLFLSSKIVEEERTYGQKNQRQTKINLNLFAVCIDELVFPT